MINIAPITKVDDATAGQIGKLKKQLSNGHELSPDKYTRAITKPQTTVLGAWSGTTLVGIAVMNTVYSLDQAYGDIDDVVVDENYRGQGISKQLLDAIVGEARRIGLNKLRLTSAAHRVAANNLYKNYGFTLFETNTYRLEI